MSSPEPVDALVMYVIVRHDIAQEWPLGAVVAQSCHAVSAVTYEAMMAQDACSLEYFAATDTMRKVVLAAPSAEELSAISTSLSDASVPHRLWREQPENICTAIATFPRPKSVMKTIRALRVLKLLKL